MKKKGILSLLIVFSVLISCGFRLIACADEAALPEEASVAVVEEAPVAVSPQQAADSVSAQQAVEAAPVQPAMESAPTQSAMEPAPVQSTTAPVSNPAPEPVSNSTPVQSATTPASNSEPEAVVTAPSNPVPESPVESSVTANDSELVSSDPTSPDKSDEDAPVATESAVLEGSASCDIVQNGTESGESNIISTEADKNTSQTGIQDVETVEPVTGAGMPASGTEIRAAEDNSGTYSITLRNRVYGYTGTPIPLGAVFQLSIHKDYLSEKLKYKWFNPFELIGEYWTGKITLENMGTLPLQGIPSAALVTVSVSDSEDEYTDAWGTNQYFAESFIVNKEHTTDLSSILTDDENSTGNIEYTYLRFPTQDGKKLFVINDSDITGDTPLELDLTVDMEEGSSYVFEYLSNEYSRKGTTITLNSNSQTTIKLGPGEYGFIIPDDNQSSTADLSKVKLIKTPANLNVTEGVSSIGDYDETSHEMTISAEKLGSLRVNPAIYSLFRAEEPKTDLGTPKTDDGNPGTDPGSDPGSPDPENDPGIPNPEPTPGSDPGNPDPGNNTEIYTPVINHTTSSPIKNKKSPDTDQPSAGTSVSQKSPSVGTSSPQTEAVDTADRTPISMYVLLMLAALVVTAAAIMISAVRSRRQFRR